MKQKCNLKFDSLILDGAWLRFHCSTCSGTFGTTYHHAYSRTYIYRLLTGRWKENEE